MKVYEEAPHKRYAILAVGLAAAAVGWFAFRQVVFPLIAIAAILGSTTEFWLPIRYVMDEKGASARCGVSVSAIEWSEIRRVIVFENSVRLSPLESDSRLSEFRGITLRFGDRKDDVLARLQAKIDESCWISGAKN